MVGSELAASKNREVDAILGSAASDDAGSLTLRVASASLLSEVSGAGLDDRNKVGGSGGWGGVCWFKTDCWGWVEAGLAVRSE